jgi:hypothetical protein
MAKLVQGLNNILPSGPDRRRRKEAPVAGEQSEGCFAVLRYFPGPG